MLNQDFPNFLMDAEGGRDSGYAEVRRCGGAVKQRCGTAAKVLNLRRDGRTRLQLICCALVSKSEVPNFEREKDLAIL